jgi:hypothetical protein
MARGLLIQAGEIVFADTIKYLKRLAGVLAFLSRVKNKQC